MSEKTVIQVSHLTKIYKLYDRPVDRLKESLGFSKKQLSHDHYALKDVSFEVKEGECVGIIGVNGSGKSTILKIITGVLAPTDGYIGVNGRISALLELGAGFNMEFTGLENVYLNGTMIGFSKEEIDRRLPDILSFADIGEFIHQPAKTYSSGMFIRLAFAVAINIDPEILIVDEALSVGDVFFQAKCFHKFEEFKKNKKTILLVSHDLSSIAKYCDRVILLHQGELLCEGAPKQMVDTYKQLLVRQAPVNLPDAAVTGTNTSEAGQKDVEEAAPDSFDIWKTAFRRNPDTLEYGDKRAVIQDFVVLDEKGYPSNAIEKGSSFQIKIKVHFSEDVQEPIIAYTFKNIQGTEITGTNTMYEKKPVPFSRKGQTCIVTFTQKMDLQGGEYLLSFGCTGYREGDFTVYHRLYDVCNVSVISSKDTVGFYDMNSQVTVEEA